MKTDETFQNKKLWAQKCINTIAGMGKFSSDRTIHEYAREIWKVEVSLSHTHTHSLCSQSPHFPKRVFLLLKF
jgi:hypothetical protein